MIDEVFNENQTAYLKGKSVMDNLRGIKYIKDVDFADLFVKVPFLVPMRVYSLTMCKFDLVYFGADSITLK